MKGWRLGLAVTAFLALEWLLIRFVDLPLSLDIRTLEATRPDLIAVCRHITDLGKSVWYLWPLGIGGLCCAAALRLGRLSSHQRLRLARLGRWLVFAFLGIALSGLLTDAFKPLIGRGRPVEYMREQLYAFHPGSFKTAWNAMPSGHATTAFAIAAILTLAWPRGRPAWLILALMLAASRVLVEAHYLADVIAGAAVGWLTVCWLHARWNAGGMNSVLQGLFPIDRQ